MHAYPEHLARSIHSALISRGLPPMAEGALDDLVSTSYQASLLRDEERQVTFRLILTEPGDLPEGGGPPSGFHPLRFEEPRPFDEEELRRLAPAAKLQRSLIGVRLHHGGLQIWGLVHSGPGWLRSQQGGRTAQHHPAAAALVIAVSGPGRLHASWGTEGIGTIVNGRLVADQIDVFESRWLRDAFRSVRGEIELLHAESRKPSWPPLAPALGGRIAQNFVRRIVATILVARHGGTVLVVPPSFSEGPPTDALRLKYVFADDGARRRYRTLVLRAMNALAASHDGTTDPVGWDAWNQSTDRDVMTTDEGIFELAHVIAGLSDVDGATVVTRRF
ncbi:diadenylate cyclase [soil metagenome]